jgi:hypothetical protein
MWWEARDGIDRRGLGPAKKLLHFKGKMARPKGFEPLALRFVECFVNET